MYKISIVDDEQVILDRLTQMVSKLDQNLFKLDSTFSNGDDAYNSLSINPPDILITDIEIPFINGLQLIRRLKRYNPLLKVIVITGYDQINYAKEAIDLGVLGFISKPITIDDLKKALNKAHLMIEQESHVETNMSELASFFRHNIAVLKENHLNKLTSLDKVSTQYIDQLHKIGLFLDYKLMRIASFDFDLVSDQNDLTLLRSLINKELVNTFKKELHFDIFEKDQKIYVLFKYNHEILKEQFLTNLELIVTKLSKYHEISVSAGLSSLSRVEHTYKKIFNESNEALNLRLAFGGLKAFSFTDYKYEDKEVLLDQNTYDEITYKVKFESENHLLVNYFRELKNKLNLQNSSYAFYISNILNAIIKASEDKIIIDNVTKEYNELYVELFNFKTLDDLINWFIKLALSIQKSNLTYIENRIDFNMEKVLAYIHNNYDDHDLNLDTLALAMNYSISYITSLFKKNKNTTFVKYLTTIRMEKAKEFILQSNYKIIEISALVGFNEPYYFSHCFKKYFGVSPKEYRDENNSTKS